MNIFSCFYFFGNEHDRVYVNDRSQQVSETFILGIRFLQVVVGSYNDVIHNRLFLLQNTATVLLRCKA